MSQTVVNFFNNFIKFDKDFKFELYSDKDITKNASIIDFSIFNKINELDEAFEKIDNSTRLEYKLNTVLPTIMNYKLRGILSIAQQINFTESNINQFLEYETKQKPTPTLESYKNLLFDYCLSDKMKIKIFNNVFPHGLHTASQAKDKKDIKGVDKIYLQKIGFVFDKVLDMICKGKDDTTVLEYVKTLITDKHASQLSGTAKKQFISTISKIDINETIDLLQIEEPTEEDKEKQKNLFKSFKQYNNEIQEWIPDVIDEILFTMRLLNIISEGLNYNKLDRKCLSSYYKQYIDNITKVRDLTKIKIENNADLIKFSKAMIDTMNLVFNNDKGVSILQDAKANVRSLLSKKDAKAFDNREELSAESIEKLFEPKNEISTVKTLIKIINTKNIPYNVKIALAIYITNEFYELIEKESYKKNWQKKTFYIKF